MSAPEVKFPQPQKNIRRRYKISSGVIKYPPLSYASGCLKKTSAGIPENF